MEESSKQDTVLDTGAEQLGRTYGTALLGAARAANAVDTVIEDFNDVIDQAFGNHPALASALQSPRVSVEEKLRVIDRVFGQKVHPVVLNFLKMTAQRGRLNFLDAIRKAVLRLHDEAEVRIVVNVRTAIPLTDPLRQSVSERLAKVFSKQVRLTETVDPSILGGMVIRLGDTVFDSSVSGQLDSLSHKVRRGFASQLRDLAGTMTGDETAIP